MYDIDSLKIIILAIRQIIGRKSSLVLMKH